MTTGERIKNARLKAGLTQAELAKKLGLPFQSISQWERDLRNPKYETLLRLAGVLNVHVLDLTDLEERMSSYRATWEISTDEGLPHEKIDEIRNLINGPLRNAYDALNDDLKLQFWKELDMMRDKSIGNISIKSSDDRLLELFHSLNEEGQEKLIGIADDLVSTGKYIKSDESQLGKEA